MHRCLLLQPGLVNYDTGLVLQNEARSLVESGRYDGILILLEHPAVITIGRGGGDENLVAHPAWFKAKGIAVAHTDRGGNVTGHNPGQLVGYPIFDLAKWRQDVHWYVHTLEEAVIRTLARYGLKAGRKAKYTGVWLADEKIAAIGVSVRRWITGHGLALNVANDLALFDAIVPCGISEFGVTSLHKAGVAAALPEVAVALAAEIAAVFDIEYVPPFGGEAL
jgi:lipoyl(octanoyl) transferase